LLRELNRRLSAAIVLISHDLGVIANVCSRGRREYAAKSWKKDPPRRCCRSEAIRTHWAVALMRHRGSNRDTPGEKRLTTDRGHAARSAELAQGLPLRGRAVRFASKKCDEHPELAAVGEGRRKSPVLGPRRWARTCRSVARRVQRQRRT